MRNYMPNNNNPITFYSFITQPSVDVIHFEETVKSDAKTISRLQFAFFYDNESKDYYCFNYTTKDIHEAVFGMDVEKFWKNSVKVVNVKNLITLMQRMVMVNKHTFFYEQINFILYICKYKSIKKSMRYLYKLLSKDKTLFDPKPGTTRHTAHCPYEKKLAIDQKQDIYGKYYNPTLTFYMNSKNIGIGNINVIHRINSNYMNAKLATKLRKSFNKTKYYLRSLRLKTGKIFNKKAA